MDVGGSGRWSVLRPILFPVFSAGKLDSPVDITASSQPSQTRTCVKIKLSVRRCQTSGEWGLQTYGRTGGRHCYERLRLSEDKKVKRLFADFFKMLRDMPGNSGRLKENQSNISTRVCWGGEPPVHWDCAKQLCSTCQGVEAWASTELTSARMSEEDVEFLFPVYEPKTFIWTVKNKSVLCMSTYSTAVASIA